MNNQMDKASHASHLGHSDSVLYLPQQEHQQQTKTSQLATTTSENQVKKPISFPFGKCRICRDKATGVHYGVITCEGCKGFFKRSITQGVPYRCFFGDNCVINMKTRNRCKACRLKLCFERGMAMESVKMGRIPKKVKEKALRNYEKYQEKLRQNQQTVLQEVPDDRSSGFGESEDSGIENGSLSSRNRESVSSISSYSSSNISNVGSQQCSYYSQEIVSIPPNLLNESEEPFCTVDLIELTVSTSSLHVNNFDHNLSTLRLPSVFSEPNTLPKTYPDILKPVESSSSTNMKQTDQIAIKPIVKNYMTVATYISKINENSLIDYMFSYDIRFSKNVLQIMRYLSQKLSQPFLIYELDFEVTSFFRYLRWKTLNSYLKHTKRLRALIERMFGIINLGITNYPGSHATITQIWEDIQKSISVDVTHLMTFAKDMPGLNELNTNDFTRILNNRVFDFYIIYNYPLFYKNESYTMTINGFQYTRHFMNQIIGKKTTDALHEFSAKLHTLNINQVEHSLIIPIILSLADEKIGDSESVYFIKYCFMYALYIQLCTTRTEDEAKFVFDQILQLVDSIEIINKLCKENIGALVLDKTLSQK